MLLLRWHQYHFSQERICQSAAASLELWHKLLRLWLTFWKQQECSISVSWFSAHMKNGSSFQRNWAGGSYISIWIIVPGLVPCQRGPQACSSSYDDDSQSKGFVQPNPTVILLALQLRCQICTSSESVKFSEILKVPKMHLCTALFFSIRREWK